MITTRASLPRLLVCLFLTVLLAGCATTTVTLPPEEPAMHSAVEFDDDERMLFIEDPWEGDLGPEKVRLARQGYYASVSFVDEQIGRILDTLSKRGWVEKTFILISYKSILVSHSPKKAPSSPNLSNCKDSLRFTASSRSTRESFGSISTSRLG